MAQRRIVGVAGAAVSALLLAGGCSGPAPDHTGRFRNERGDARPTPAAACDQPVQVVRGVPQGWPRTGEGARLAAVTAIRLTGSVARAGFITRRDMIHELATAAFSQELADSTSRQLFDLTSQLGDHNLAAGDLLWNELPLTARTTRADRATAVVQVWSVLVIAAPAVGVPHQVWRTVTIDFAWERRSWRISAWRVRPGPTPAVESEADVATVGQIEQVADWPVAAGAGHIP